MCLVNIFRDYGSLIQSLIVVAGIYVAWRQLSHLKRNTQGDAMTKLIGNHRELITFELTHSSELEDAEAKRHFNAMLLNHAANAYFNHENKIIPDDWWEGMVNDMKAAFNTVKFREFWEEGRVKSCYSVKFRSFMDNCVIGK